MCVRAQLVASARRPKLGFKKGSKSDSFCFESGYCEKPGNFSRFGSDLFIILPNLFGSDLFKFSETSLLKPIAGHTAPGSITKHGAVHAMPGVHRLQLCRP